MLPNGNKVHLSGVDLFLAEDLLVLMEESVIVLVIFKQDCTGSQRGISTQKLDRGPLLWVSN